MNRGNKGVFKAVIIGAGASGLALAVKLSLHFGGENVALIERLDRVGKKLLSTGNGQCNLTNVDCDLSHFHSEKLGFFENIITNYGKNSVQSFFESLGIPLTEDGGKVYPLSKQASSVLDALRFKISALNTQCFLGEKIVDIKKQGDLFTIYSDSGKVFNAQNVIVSVGGNSQKHLGTDGSSYTLLENFGHKKTKLYPSIVQLKADVKRLKGLKGLKQKVNAFAVVDKKVVANSYGDIMFTDYGLSGNVAFYLSSYFAGKNNSFIQIDFCPELNQIELINFIKNKQKNCSYLNVEHLLSGIMNTKIACAILRNLGFSLELTVDKINAEEISMLIKNYRVEILGSLGFDGAQVTKGGIAVSEFDNKTLQSKLIKNLYATGEVLDVDGDCGGYNLTWAFSSAFAVADAIK